MAAPIPLERELTWIQVAAQALVPALPGDPRDIAYRAADIADALFREGVRRNEADAARRTC